MSVLDISKTLMYEFWYDYIKPKYQDNAKLCYMDTNSFIAHIKTEEFYKDVAGETSNDSEDDKRPLPRGKNKKKLDFLRMNYSEKL